MNFLEQATRALGLGYSVFPVLCYSTIKDGAEKREKKPLVPWAEYQKRLPTKEEIQKWADDPLIKQYGGLGIPTGALEGQAWHLVVIDFDKDGGCQPLELAEAFPWYSPEKFPVWCRSGSGGMHLYTKHAEPIINGQAVLESNGIKVDIRADGGFIVGPPSPLWDNDPRDIHSRARIKAEYMGHLDTLNSLPATPAEILEAMQNTTKQKKPAYTAIADNNGVVPEGKRHLALVSFTLSFLNRTKGLESLPAIKQMWTKAVREHFANADPDSKEYQTAWETAVNKIRAEDKYSWEISKPLARQAAAEALSERDYANDMHNWGFTVDKAVRVGDIIVLHISFTSEFGELTRARVKILTKDFFSQTAFRTAFLQSVASRPLKKIKPNSYEQFITSLEIIEEKGTGVDTIEIVREELIKRFSQMVDVEDGNEAEETLIKKGMVRFNNKLMFKLQNFRLSSPVLRGIKDNIIVIALEDVGAHPEKYGKAGNIWGYEQAT